MGKKVLFASQEVMPYVPETEMSFYGSEIPHIVQEAGFGIRTFMPGWGNIDERRGRLHKVIHLSGMNLIIDDTDHPLIIKVVNIPQTRVQVYFTDNGDHFQKRPAMTGDELGNGYPDNGERAIFFARGVLETVEELRWAPNMIHYQGWMSSVIPFYVKTTYKGEPQFASSKVVTSLFAEQPQDSLGTDSKRCPGFHEARARYLKNYDDDFGFIELGKLAIDYFDDVIGTGDKAHVDLINYVRTHDKQLLEYTVDDAELKEKYSEFYNKLL